MCCFSQPVESVADTRLFARMGSGGTQHLVYQMQFESRTPNAMILPLPIALPAREDSVRFVSLKEYDGFFSDLNRGFPDLNPPPAAFPSRSLPTDSLVEKKLEVHEVGDFVASFVPTLDDFGRLDPQFVIPRKSWDQLPEYHDYGFAVFQLKTLAGQPHPMAFEFETRWADRIFFPAVHIHDGEVHRVEEFDHMLYLQAAEFDRLVKPYRGPQQADPGTGFVRSQLTAGQFSDAARSEGILQPDLLVHRLEMRGRLPNRDVIQPVAGAAPGGLQARKPRNPVWPGGVALGAAAAGFFWLAHRRNLIGKSGVDRRDGPGPA